MITDQKVVVGLPGEEEKDQEGRGEAAFHAGMGARGMEKAAGQDWVFCCGTQWHSVAGKTRLRGRGSATEDTHHQHQSIARQGGAEGGPTRQSL